MQLTVKVQAFRYAVEGALRHQHSLSLSPAPEEREAGSAPLFFPPRCGLFATRLKALRATSTPSPSVPLLRSGKPEMSRSFFPLSQEGDSGGGSEAARSAHNRVAKRQFIKNGAKGL
ncbi:MAG: hypothetical protein EBX40_05205 [Gammaproteobacteria bacterium]|nr:hypothetical protein [Gammaproteobacteria bacterium]